MSEVRIYGVLVTYQRPEDLAGSMRVLSSQSRQLDHLIVVNNDPGADLSMVIDANGGAATTIELLNAEDNLGPAGGIDLGMRAALVTAADDDLVLVLDDDDPLPDDRAVEDVCNALLARIDVEPKMGGVGLRGAVMNSRTGRLGKPDLVSGSAQVAYLKSNWAPLYRVGAIRTVGPFRADLFFGFDDLEFGLRLNDAGYVLEAHELGRKDLGTTPSPSRGFRRTPWRTYYTIRNLVAVLWGFGFRRAALRNAAILGVVKPLVNLVAGPDRSGVQVKMSGLAVFDAGLGRMGRRVLPSKTKLSVDPSTAGKDDR